MRHQTGTDNTSTARTPQAMPADLAALKILFLPAMGVPAGYYEPLLARLRAATGATVVAVDLPGQGNHAMRARRGHDYGYREVVEDLIPRTVRVMQGADASGRVVLAGHSLGGQLAVLSLATLASHVEALFLVAAGTAHWRVWPGRNRWKSVATVNTFALLNRILPWYPGRTLGFGGDQAKRFMRDWSFNALGGRYRLEGSARGTHEIESQLAQVRTPVHVLSIADDPVAPPGATRELLRLLPRACITHHAVRGVMSDPPWRRHFSWARQECDIEPAIVDGLASVVASEPSRRSDAGGASAALGRGRCACLS